jgi:hypothetical protein
MNTPMILVTIYVWRMQRSSLRMDHYGKRKIWEAMEIELNENNLNRDDGLKLSKTWKPVLQKLK